MNNSISNKSISLSDLNMIDMGVKVPAGWSSGKKLIETITGGLGDISFGEFYTNGYALPTIDIFYDDPKKIKLPLNKKIDGRKFYLYENVKLVYSELNEIPSITIAEEIAAAFNNKVQDLKFVITTPTSLIAAIYGCFLSMPIIKDKLLSYGFQEEEMEWAWSSIALPTLADDKQILDERMKAAFDYGTITSFWVRTEDEKIEKVLASMDLCGELRIHNLSSAKTFIHGSLNVEKLQDSFGIYLK